MDGEKKVDALWGPLQTEETEKTERSYLRCLCSLLFKQLRGAIPADVAPIFERLGLDGDDWLSNQLSLEAKYHAPIPPVDQLRVPPPD